MTILLVEDEAIVATVIEEYLTDAGFTVVTAFDGAAAMRTLDNPDIALDGLVTDIRLPGGYSGWDIARMAREKVADLAVVYASGDSSQDWKAYGVPESIMLGKPFVSAQLITALSQLLNARSNLS